MKPNLRVVTHLYLLAELSKAQKKNSPQAVLYACGQDNLQKDALLSRGLMLLISVREEGSVVSGACLCPASPLIPVSPRSFHSES